MKTIPEKDMLICIYCLEMQEHPAIDYIPFNPNLQGISKPSYSTSVQEEKCTECDSTLYLKLNDNHTISIANTPHM
jgi:hypothetical protein